MKESLQNNNIDWNGISEKFISSYGEATFNSWIKPLGIIEYNDSYLTLSAPTRFIKDWVNSNYLEKIESLVKEYLPNLMNISIIVKTSKNDTGVAPTNPQEGFNNYASISEKLSENSVVAINNNKTIGNRNVNLNSKQSFENFIVSDNNRFANYASKQIASVINGEESQDSIEGFNPLYIFGGVGFGKTHLLNAIGNSVKEKSPETNIVYLSAEKFMFKFVKALKENNIFSFKEEVRNADILLIDDIHFFSGKGQVQEEFLHCFNSILESGGNIIIASDRCPNDLDRIDEKLRSRLGGGLVTEIQKPDAELREKIIKEKSADLLLELDEEAIDMISSKLSKNVRELVGFLNKLKVRNSAFSNSKIISADNIRAMLSNEFTETNELTIEAIKKLVCKKFDISITEMDSAKRSSHIAKPRQIAMYFAKKYTRKSLPEIGRNFGGKNHATVLHAVKAVEKMRTTLPEIYSQIKEVEANFS